MYWEKRCLFLIGNGAEIRPLEMGRKSPGLTHVTKTSLTFLQHCRSKPRDLVGHRFNGSPYALYSGCRGYWPGNRFGDSLK